MKLSWSEPKQKFIKQPTDLKTGLPANSDEMGVSFSLAMDHLVENTVLSYRQPESSSMRLGLIDCDRCIREDGSISPLVQNMLRYLNMYAEYSVSNGIHVLCWLDAVPPGGHMDDEWHVEFYWKARSIPITGNRVKLPDWESPDDVQQGTKKFLTLHKARFGKAWLPPAPPPMAERSCALSREQIVSKLFREPDGRKWSDIYGGQWHGYYESPSDADLALLMKFAFYTGKDRQMMESMFSECPMSMILARGTAEKPKIRRTPKWEVKDYRKRSLDKAIENTTNVYTPRRKPMSAQELYAMGRQQIHETRK